MTQTFKTVLMLVVFGSAISLVGCHRNNQAADSANNANNATIARRDDVKTRADSTNKISTTEPSAVNSDQPTDPIDLLHKLAGDQSLKLSTADAHSPKNFHIIMQIAGPIADIQGNAAGKAVTNMYVVRCDGQTAVLCASGSNLPRSIMTQGLLVAIDRDHPGGIMVFQRGAPFFWLGSSPTHGGMDFELTYHSELTEAEVTLDLASLITSILNKMEEAHFNSTERLITIESKNSAVTIRLSPNKSSDHAEFPVQDFTIHMRSTGSLIRIFNLGVDSAPPFEPSALTAQAVQSLGLPTDVTNDPPADTMKFLVPRDFGDDPREKNASMRLGELVHLRGTAPAR